MATPQIKTEIDNMHITLGKLKYEGEGSGAVYDAIWGQWDELIVEGDTEWEGGRIVRGYFLFGPTLTVQAVRELGEVLIGVHVAVEEEVFWFSEEQLQLIRELQENLLRQHRINQRTRRG